MLDLIQEVVKAKFIGGNFFVELSSLLDVELLLGTFYERNHVAHAQDSVRHAVGMEDVQGLHFFARTDKFDGLLNDLANAERRTSSGVAVEFGQDYARVVKHVVKGLGCIHGILACHGVDDK